jgi:hypothetical protein
MVLSEICVEASGQINDNSEVKAHLRLRLRLQLRTESQSPNNIFDLNKSCDGLGGRSPMLTNEETGIPNIT